MFARVARYEVPADKLSEAVEGFSGAVKELEELPGFEHAYVLVDDEDGALLTITLWATRTAMESSSSQAARLRRSAAQVAEGEIQSVRQYEVVAEQRGPAAAAS